MITSRKHYLSLTTVCLLLLAVLIPARVMGAGPYASKPFPIATSANDERFPVVAYDTGRHRFLVVFENGGGMTAVCLTAMGQTVATYVVPTSSTPYAPDVAYNQGHDQYLVVWSENGIITGARVPGQCWPGPGGISAAFTISGDRPATTAYPAVAYNSHANHQDYLVVWSEGGTTSSVFARRVTASGLNGASFAVADSAGQDNWRPDVAYNLNRNEYLVVYVRGTGTSEDIYGRRVFNANGGGLLAEQPIDTTSNAQEDPAVAAYRLNSTTPYLVVYTDRYSDTPGDITGALCNTSGQLVSYIEIAAVSGKQEMAPAITSSELLGYTVVWQQVDPSDAAFDIYGRRVSDTGTSQQPFEISLGERLFTPGHDEAMPAIAGGSPLALVVWHEDSAGGSDIDVFGRFLGHSLFLPVVLRGWA